MKNTKGPKASISGGNFNRFPSGISSTSQSSIKRRVRKKNRRGNHGTKSGVTPKNKLNNDKGSQEKKKKKKKKKIVTRKPKTLKKTPGTKKKKEVEVEVEVEVVTFAKEFVDGLKSLPKLLVVKSIIPFFSRNELFKNDRNASEFHYVEYLSFSQPNSEKSLKFVVMYNENLRYRRGIKRLFGAKLSPDPNRMKEKRRKWNEMKKCCAKLSPNVILFNIFTFLEFCVEFGSKNMGNALLTNTVMTLKDSFGYFKKDKFRTPRLLTRNLVIRDLFSIPEFFMNLKGVLSLSLVLSRRVKHTDQISMPKGYNSRKNKLFTIIFPNLKRLRLVDLGSVCFNVKLVAPLVEKIEFQDAGSGVQKVLSGNWLDCSKIKSVRCEKGDIKNVFYTPKGTERFTNIEELSFSNIEELSFSRSFSRGFVLRGAKKLRRFVFSNDSILEESFKKFEFPNVKFLDLRLNSVSSNSVNYDLKSWKGFKSLEEVVISSNGFDYTDGYLNSILTSTTIRRLDLSGSQAIFGKFGTDFTLLKKIKFSYLDNFGDAFFQYQSLPFLEELGLCMLPKITGNKWKFLRRLKLLLLIRCKLFSSYMFERYNFLGLERIVVDGQNKLDFRKKWEKLPALKSFAVNEVDSSKVSMDFFENLPFRKGCLPLEKQSEIFELKKSTGVDFKFLQQFLVLEFGGRGIIVGERSFAYFFFLFELIRDVMFDKLDVRYSDTCMTHVLEWMKRNDKPLKSLHVRIQYDEMLNEFDTNFGKYDMKTLEEFGITSCNYEKSSLKGKGWKPFSSLHTLSLCKVNLSAPFAWVVNPGILVRLFLQEVKMDSLNISGFPNLIEVCIADPLQLKTFRLVRMQLSSLRNLKVLCLKSVKFSNEKKWSFAGKLKSLCLVRITGLSDSFFVSHVFREVTKLVLWCNGKGVKGRSWKRRNFPKLRSIVMRKGKSASLMRSKLEKSLKGIGIFQTYNRRKALSLSRPFLQI